MTEKDIELRLLVSAQNLSTYGLIRECLKIAKSHGAVFETVSTSTITESQFKEQCMAGYTDPANPEMIAETALRLAKRHGAKFEEEFLDLPDLQTYTLQNKPIVGGNNFFLTYKECQEVIRRCRVVKKMNDFIATLTPGAGLNTREIQILISILKES